MYADGNVWAARGFIFIVHPSIKVGTVCSNADPLCCLTIMRWEKHAPIQASVFFSSRFTWGHFSASLSLPDGMEEQTLDLTLGLAEGNL